MGSKTYIIIVGSHHKISCDVVFNSLICLDYLTKLISHTLDCFKLSQAKFYKILQDYVVVWVEQSYTEILQAWVGECDLYEYGCCILGTGFFLLRNCVRWAMLRGDHDDTKHSEELWSGASQKSTVPWSSRPGLVMDGRLMTFKWPPQVFLSNAYLFLLQVFLSNAYLFFPQNPLCSH